MLFYAQSTQLKLKRIGILFLKLILLISSGVRLWMNGRHVQRVGGIRTGKLGLFSLPCGFAAGFAFLAGFCWGASLCFRFCCCSRQNTRPYHAIHLYYHSAQKNLPSESNWKCHYLTFSTHSARKFLAGVKPNLSNQSSDSLFTTHITLHSQRAVGGEGVGVGGWSWMNSKGRINKQGS